MAWRSEGKRALRSRYEKRREEPAASNSPTDPLRDHGCESAVGSGYKRSRERNPFRLVSFEKRRSGPALRSTTVLSRSIDRLFQEG